MDPLTVPAAAGSNAAHPDRNGDRDAHGHAVMHDVSKRTSGKIRLSPGTLYGAIKRLSEDGLIAEVERRAALA